MSYEIVPYGDRAEWLQLRRTGIGASDIAAILGVSPWSTPHQIWISKVVDEAPEPEQSEDMMWGWRMEQLILDGGDEQLGITTTRSPFGILCRDLDRPWLMSSIDGLSQNPETIVEAKKVDDWSWDLVPLHYQYQTQWQLATTGYDKAWIAALHRGRRLELYPVERDEEVIAELVAAGERFWTDHVLTKEPPPVVAADDPFMALMWPQHIEAAVEVDEDLAVELRAAKAAAKAATERLQLAEARVKEIMGEASTAVVGDEIVATWKTQTARRVNVKMLQAEEPELAETYTKESTSRVFRLKESK